MASCERSTNANQWRESIPIRVISFFKIDLRTNALIDHKGEVCHSIRQQVSLVTSSLMEATVPSRLPAMIKAPAKGTHL
jgi:hypothetical protein